MTTWGKSNKHKIANCLYIQIHCPEENHSGVIAVCVIGGFKGTVEYMDLQQARDLYRTKKLVNFNAFSRLYVLLVLHLITVLNINITDKIVCII